MRFFVSFFGVQIWGFEFSWPQKNLILPGDVPSEHAVDLYRELENLTIEDFDLDD